jgi:hypothetical protein
MDSWNTKRALGEVSASFSLDDEFIPLGFLDDLKQSLDAVGQGPAGVGSGLKGSAAGAARRMARQLRGMVDDALDSPVSPYGAGVDYAGTRQAYQAGLQRLEAMGAQKGTPGGRQLFQTTKPAALDEIEEGLSGLSDDALSDFRVGAAKSAEDLLANRATRTGDVGNIFRPDVEGGRMARALDIAATSPEAAVGARQALEAESAMQGTFSRLTQGSKTQPNIAATARGATLYSQISDILMPAGLTQETAESMRTLLARDQITISELERIVNRGIRSGVLDVTPEQAARWLRGLTGAQRTGQQEYGRSG